MTQETIINRVMPLAVGAVLIIGTGKFIRHYAERSEQTVAATPSTPTADALQRHNTDIAVMVIGAVRSRMTYPDEFEMLDDVTSRLQVVNDSAGTCFANGQCSSLNGFGVKVRMYWAVSFTISNEQATITDVVVRQM